ncbi:hypothetical protein BBW65_01305 [Helicobacter enhydrae]|uniref:DJ-1/PfpI domain-containing protein n=1 Tax=Helicobacter enhydrae TaxID=222136 RepID=A0A1B1U445_9HELI|nr:DJ-1 family glyoxalase III [Helicobacter enhydrae]ANV97526.1 hypothetical protein BBW65_01305 [Helicobacter enhydrae]
MSKKSNKQILVPFAEGFEEIELVSIVDILRRAGVGVSLASIDASPTQKGAHHIAIVADMSLEDAKIDQFDGIVMAGGMLGVQNMQKSSTLLQFLQTFHSQQKLIGAICAAPIILDDLKLLKQDFCCYPSCENLMKNTTASRLVLPYIKQGHIITATGPASALEFALGIVESLLGIEEKSKLAKELLRYA